MAFTHESANQPVWANSFFIPQIAFGLTKTQIKSHFENNKIGRVSRVDFVSFNSDKGTGRRAFVHFDDYFDQGILSHIEHNGYCDTNICGSTVRLMINTKPVPPTRLNIDQIASNTEFIGDEVKVISEKTDALMDFKEWTCARLDHKDAHIHKLEQQCNTQIRINAALQSNVETQSQEIESLKQQMYQMQQMMHNVMMMVPPPPITMLSQQMPAHMMIPSRTPIIDETLRRASIVLPTGHESV